MDDWEDEQIAPLPAKVELKSNWDDEDVDENEIKDSWEDDDEPALPPVVKPAPEKAPKKTASKTVEKKGKAVEVPIETPKEESLDPIAEKLRQQRLVEEADYRSTAELFGVKDEEKNLDMFIPKSESDFLEYAEMISHRIKPYEKSYHYIALLKTVMRLSLTNMKAADVKDVASSITAIANEKLKAEKEAAAGKKKTGGKKKQLIVDKPDDDLVAGPYDAWTTSISCRLKSFLSKWNLVCPASISSFITPKKQSFLIVVHYSLLKEQEEANFLVVEYIVGTRKAFVWVWSGDSLERHVFGLLLVIQLCLKCPYKIIIDIDVINLFGDPISSIHGCFSGCPIFLVCLAL